MDPLDGLNPEQRRAAEAVRGSVCILAGAGSGKTTTITRRIAQQVASGAFAPTQIMAVTFTDKAAGELRARLAVARGVGIALRPDAAVLRPFDLAREVAGGPELERRAQPVADLAEQQRLRREDATELVRGEVAELPERRGVERPRAHARHAERGETYAQLTARLVGERHRHDLRRVERAGRDLLRDTARDRRRLAGAGAREDAHGAAHRLGGAPLLRIQSVERIHPATVSGLPAGIVTGLRQPR